MRVDTTTVAEISVSKAEVKLMRKLNIDINHQNFDYLKDTIEGIRGDLEIDYDGKEIPDEIESLVSTLEEIYETVDRVSEESDWETIKIIKEKS